jgi:radical SAM protein with 4Fe4S-binding SPASM domain
MLQGQILERFLKDPPLRFNISLYGGSNETYRGMCGLPVYDRVKENIRALRQAGIGVSLNLSITPYNYQDLEQIYADAVELDVNVKASSYMYPPIRLADGSYGCGNRLSAEDAARCSVLWDAIRFTPEEFALRAQGMEKLTDVCGDGCPLEEGEGIRCRAGSSSFWITWQGKMLPCGMMTEPVADLRKQSFEEAWEYIRSESAKVRLPAECGSCAYKEVCGVCASVCYTETGRFDGVPTYICEKTKQQVRLTQEIYRERCQNED